MRRLLLFLVAVLLAYQSEATCTAGFTYSGYSSQYAPLYYTFHNTSTWSTTGGVVGNPTYLMDYGDGSGYTGVSPYYAYFYHTYTTPGTYTAKLVLTVRDTVTNALYCSDTSTQTIVVNYSPCFSTISSSFSQATGTFTAHNLANTPGATFTWIFGDGTSATGSPVTHTYAGAGPYLVSLVTTTSSCLDSSIAYVYPLTCSGIHAQFTQSTTGMTTSFNSSSSTGNFGSGSQVFHWNFGDGTTSAANNPTHTYTAPGTYTVQLFYTATDTATGFSCSDSISHQVTINYSCASNHVSYYSWQSGSITYFVNNSTGAGTPSYLWSFGDGTTSTSANPTHTYAANGSYHVNLHATWTMSGFTCSDSLDSWVYIGTNSCSNHHANMYYYASGSSTYQFYNNSSTFPGQTNASLWMFGDGTTSTTLNPIHTYSTPGNYNVVLINKWVDSANNVVCIDSTYTNLSVSNSIQGYIHVDSTTMTTPDTFKVWLIQNDSVNNTLTAVDSQIVSGYWWINYQFNNEPAGVYFTKAQLLGQATGSNGYVPTYHDSSLYWSQATPIYHNGANSISKDIYMRHGIVTSGPGFVGGNISMGANKGTGTTGTGVPGVIVYLRNNFGQLVQSAFTDANGDFSFSNVPLGSYSLYPEAMNYLTTPIGGIQVTAANPSLTGYRFGQTATEIKPKTTGVENIGKIDFSLYPNPANNKVQIQWNETSGTANITITDIAGRKVYQSENVKMSGATEINTAAMQPGMYFIKIASDNNQHTIKLLIQH